MICKISTYQIIYGKLPHIYFGSIINIIVIDFLYSLYNL